MAPKAEALLLKVGGSGEQLLQALESVTGAARVALVSKSKNVEALAAWLEKVCGTPRAGARPERGRGPTQRPGARASAHRARRGTGALPARVSARPDGGAYESGERARRARTAFPLFHLRAEPRASRLAPQETSLGASMDMELVKELADLVPVSGDMTRCAVAALGEAKGAGH